MNAINFTRLGHLLKLDLVQNRKKYLQFSLGLLLGHLMIQYFTFQHVLNIEWNIERYGMEYAMDNLNQDLSPSIFFFFGVVICIAMSSLFNHLPEKINRTYYLMLPASNAEKVFSRAIICLGIIPVMFLVTLVGADLIRMAIYPLRGTYIGTMLPLIFEETWTAISTFFSILFQTYSKCTLEDVRLAWFLVGFGLWGLSCFALGSIVFRRRAFIFTFITLVVLFVAFSLVATHLPGSFRLHYSWPTLYVLDILFIILFYVAAVAQFWLTWRLFTRTQVIPRKLFGK